MKKSSVSTPNSPTLANKGWLHFKQNIPYMVMVFIPVVFFAVFCYWPMFGVSLAFQNYKAGAAFFSANTKWVGFMWFERLFKNPMLWRWIKNTLALSFLDLIFAFPLSIVIALFLNEIRQKWFRSLTANVSLLPYFISTVVIIGIMGNMFSVDDGVINLLIERMGHKKINFMGSSEWFRTMYIGSGMWQGCGFGAVVYTAAISGIDPTLYEAAELDGSNRIKNVFYITIPCILPTIITMLILRIGSLMGVGYEKILLMANEGMYEVADTLSTYSYRAGILDNKQSMATAIGLFNSLCNITLLVTANFFANKYSETSLW